jgi:flagellar hook-associated protein 2
MATVVGASTGAIDVKSTVDQLIELEMVKRIDPIDKKLTARQSSVSALSSLKALSSSLQDSLDGLADRTQFTVSSTLTAEQALANLSAASQSFVTNFNALQAGVVRYGTVDLADPTRDTASKVALLGDSALSELRQLMRSGYSSGLTYTNNLSNRADKTSVINFADLGISRKIDGTLGFSKAAFTKSAESVTTGLPTATDPKGSLADTAYAQPKLLDRFATGTASALKTNLAKAGSTIVGTFDARTAQYNNQLYTLRNKRVSESSKIESERARLLKTYSQLNSLLANMSSTSNFLTAQLASLSKNNN